MDALMNVLGIHAQPGYEYVYFILEGCLAIFIVMEIIGWIMIFFKNIFGRG